VGGQGRVVGAWGGMPCVGVGCWGKGRGSYKWLGMLQQAAAGKHRGVWEGLCSQSLKCHTVWRLVGGFRQGKNGGQVKAWVAGLQYCRWQGRQVKLAAGEPQQRGGRNVEWYR